jgi:large subunit ribosomal protein L22
MKAVLKNYRQSPRKVRLVADLVRGKKVTTALAQLQFVDKRASAPVAKLIKSAVANAEQNGFPAEQLIIRRIHVDKGMVLKRFMARARGAASRINKRNSHITIELSTKATTTATTQT